MKRNFLYGLLVGFLSIFLVFAVVATVRAQSSGPDKPFPNPDTTISQPAEPSSGSGSSVGTTISYQGLLKKNGVPFTGSCDMLFNLWDTVTKDNFITSTTPFPYPVTVTNGLFTTWLDFGDVFIGDKRYLEPVVSCPASGSPAFVSLGVQLIYPTPYALSLREGTTISGTNYTGVKIVDNAVNGNALEAYANNGSNGWGVVAQGSGAGVVASSDTSNGEAVVANGSDNFTTPNTALKIYGGKIKVAGTVKPAFVFTVSVVGSNCTSISNPLINGDPDAIIIVTPRQDTTTVPSTDVRVLYNAGTWNLCSPTLAPDMKYNMLIINQ